MATPSEKLAQSLEELRRHQNKNGFAVLHSSFISRTHRERLLSNGFIKPVIKGWYISSRPDEKTSDTTSWYISFWYFVSVYLEYRFGDDWCLSPEQSLLLHSENRTVPKQLPVRSPKAQNNVTNLLYETSLLDIKLEIPRQNERAKKEGLYLYSLQSALTACSPEFFKHYPTDARTCLAMVKDSSGILTLLLEGGNSVKASRLAGAFRNTGSDKIADDILSTMKKAGYDAREEDPFQEKLSVPEEVLKESPWVTRLRLMWHQMRQTVIENFPADKSLPCDKEAYLKQVDEKYTEDAYNSLSIEGYQVSPELIEKVKSGLWNPDLNEQDNVQRNAMAARGYWQAFQKVKEAVSKVIEGQNAGNVAYKEHNDWYQELFAPGVSAGIIKPADLAGYRNHQVYIKGSKHIPPNKKAVRDAMPVLFDLLKEEKNAAVRIVLGHFIFVYIHPYMDGNGRMCRFLMNLMMASGGHPWTIIPVDKRGEYMSALEEASVNKNIQPFAAFLVGMVIKNSYKNTSVMSR